MKKKRKKKKEINTFRGEGSQTLNIKISVLRKEETKVTRVDSKTWFLERIMLWSHFLGIVLSVLEWGSSQLNSFRSLRSHRFCGLTGTKCHVLEIHYANRILLSCWLPWFTKISFRGHYCISSLSHSVFQGSFSSLKYMPTCRGKHCEFQQLLWKSKFTLIMYYKLPRLLL